MAAFTTMVDDSGSEDMPGQAGQTFVMLDGKLQPGKPGPGEKYWVMKGDGTLKAMEPGTYMDDSGQENNEMAYGGGMGAAMDTSAPQRYADGTDYNWRDIAQKLASLGVPMPNDPSQILAVALLNQGLLPADMANWVKAKKVTAPGANNALPTALDLSPDAPRVGVGSPASTPLPVPGGTPEPGSTIPPATPGGPQASTLPYKLFVPGVTKDGGGAPAIPPPPAAGGGNTGPVRTPPPARDPSNPLLAPVAGPQSNANPLLEGQGPTSFNPTLSYDADAVRQARMGQMADAMGFSNPNIAKAPQGRNAGRGHTSYARPLPPEPPDDSEPDSDGDDNPNNHPPGDVPPGPAEFAPNKLNDPGGEQLNTQMGLRGLPGMEGMIPLLLAELEKQRNPLFSAYGRGTQGYTSPGMAERMVTRPTHMYGNGSKVNLAQLFRDLNQPQGAPPMPPPPPAQPVQQAAPPMPPAPPMDPTQGYGMGTMRYAAGSLLPDPAGDALRRSALPAPHPAPTPMPPTPRPTAGPTAVPGPMTFSSRGGPAPTTPPGPMNNGGAVNAGTIPQPAPGTTTPPIGIPVSHGMPVGGGQPAPGFDYNRDGNTPGRYPMGFFPSRGEEGLSYNAIMQRRKYGSSGVSAPLPPWMMPTEPAPQPQTGGGVYTPPPPGTPVGTSPPIIAQPGQPGFPGNGPPIGIEPWQQHPPNTIEPWQQNPAKPVALPPKPPGPMTPGPINTGTIPLPAPGTTTPPIGIPNGNGASTQLPPWMMPTEPAPNHPAPQGPPPGPMTPGGYHPDPDGMITLGPGRRISPASLAEYQRYGLNPLTASWADLDNARHGRLPAGPPAGGGGGGGMPVPPQGPPVQPPGPATPTGPQTVSYGDDAYNNLRALRLLRGEITPGEFNSLGQQGSYDPTLGVNIPAENAMNYANMMRIAQDPTTYATTQALFRASNRDYDSTMARAQQFAPLGNAYNPSLIRSR